MSIPYRVRRSIRRFASAVLILAVLCTLALGLWLLWLNRYVVYSKDGVRLDFTIDLEYQPGVAPVEPPPIPTVTIHGKTEEDDPQDPENNALQQLSGYYVTLSQLTEDFETTEAVLDALPEGSTVLLQLKDVTSRVYYTSAAADEKSNFDTVAVDGLIARLQSRGHYVIAAIPAFQEYHFILANERERVSWGLPRAGGNGALWLDKDGPCYWLDPTSDGTISWLIQLITELRSLGFDEVLLQDFRFPNTDKISFDGDRQQALTETAATLVKTCSTDRFCVSFARPTADLSLPQGRTRLYLTAVSASDADTQASLSGLSDPVCQVVFLTELSDTRYEEYSVLRPLPDAVTPS